MTEPKINEKAPERLFAWSFNNWKEWGGWVRGNTRGDTDLGPFNEKERSTGSEYVRADLFDALTAERDALRAQIEAGAEDTAALLRDCRERILTDADAFAKAGRISRAIKCDLLIDRIDAAINSTPRDETAV